MTETYTFNDPFLNKVVEVSHNLTDRLRGKYACGPIMPDGEPEFGWREFPTPPVQQEAAKRIEELEKQLAAALEDRARFPQKPDEMPQPKNGTFCWAR